MIRENVLQMGPKVMHAVESRNFQEHTRVLRAFSLRFAQITAYQHASYNSESLWCPLVTRECIYRLLSFGTLNAFSSHNRLFANFTGFLK